MAQISYKDRSIVLKKVSFYTYFLGGYRHFKKCVILLLMAESWVFTAEDSVKIIRTTFDEATFFAEK